MLALFVAFLSFGERVAFGKSMVPLHERLTTRNGVEIIFFPSPNIPLFQVELAFDFGADRDPPGKSGLSRFSVAMIRRGTEGLDEEAISRRMDDLAAGIDFSAGSERTTLGAYGLNEHAPAILELFFRLLSGPTFPEKPFRRIRGNTLDYLKQLTDSASALSTHVLNAVVFNGTAQSRPLSGLRKDMERLDLEDVKAFLSEIVRADRLKVLVVGGKGHGEILRRVITGIEALNCLACGKAAPASRPWRFPKWDVPPGHVVVVRRPGLTEAHVRMGFLGPKRDIPEFYDLRVAETILSGHFGSKLNEEIREKRNLTYSIDADFSFGKTFGVFSVSSGTQNEKVGELLVAVNQLLMDFRAGVPRGGMTAEDLKLAQDYLVGSFPLGMQNLYSIAGGFFSGILTGLNPDFIDVYRDRIRGVTLESMKAAVRKYLTLEEMKTVVVGDPDLIGPRLTAKGLKYVAREPADFL